MANSQKSRRKQRPQPKAAAPGSQVVIPRPLRPWTCTRSFNLGSITPLSTEQGYSVSASLSQLPSNSEFTSLFLEYRILKADYEVTYLSGDNDRYNVVLWAGNFPTSYNSSPPDLNAVMQLSGASKFAFGPDKRVRRVGFPPLIRTGDQVYQLRRSPWISIVTAGANHGGLWFWFQYFDTTYALGSRITLTATYTLQFRGSH